MEIISRTPEGSRFIARGGCCPWNRRRNPKDPQPRKGRQNPRPSGRDFHSERHAQGRFALGYSLPPPPGEIRLELGTKQGSYFRPIP
jgi:hypothetical protein